MHCLSNNKGLTFSNRIGLSKSSQFERGNLTRFVLTDSPFLLVKEAYVYFVAGGKKKSGKQVADVKRESLELEKLFSQEKKKEKRKFVEPI